MKRRITVLVTRVDATFGAQRGLEHLIDHPDDLVTPLGFSHCRSSVVQPVS
jgi:hypothetical protein